MNILYILNHKILSDFEIPILIKNNFGVYLPKIYNSLSPYDSINFNNHYIYDYSLNINTNHYNYLNNFDFFNKCDTYNDELMNIINNNFNVIFIALYANITLIDFLVQKFNGTIYLRFFGRERDLSYSDFFKSHKYLSNTPKLKFIFSYPEIIDFEFNNNNFFHNNNSLYIPLGIPDYFFNKYNNIYNNCNNSNNFVFVCSKINICDYYTQIYNDFNNLLIDFDFIILGRNNININDHRIKNNLNDHEYYTQMANSIAMYYHGKEPRHLHYHPIEAIIIGLPIIFHAESLLSTYLNDSPGKCYNDQEVIEKLNKIKNNIDFKNEIIKYQNNIQQIFTTNYNLNIFEKLLLL